MKRSQVDSILDKVHKRASAQAAIRGILPTRTPIKDVNSNGIDDDDEEEYVPVGVGGLIAASAKLLAINRGLDKTDARDALMFKRILTPDRLIGERIKLDAEGIRRSIMNRVSRSKSLSALHPFTFDGYTEKFIVGNPLSSPLEEINPLHLVEQSRRVTQMGPGGIGTDNAITESMQCHDPETEVLTKTGWKYWPAVTYDDELACKINGRMEFHKPEMLTAQHYTGIMYGVKSMSVNFLVTPNHRFFTASSRRTKNWRWETAVEHHGKFRVYSATSEPYLGTDNSDHFVLPPVEFSKTGDKHTVPPPIDMGDWCEFLGWFMSEGSTYNKHGTNYAVIISQCDVANPTKVNMIHDLLSRLPFVYHRSDTSNNNFTMNSKVLYTYLSAFGKCKDKYIPEFLFEVKPEYRRRFLNSFLLGDGHQTKSGNRLYSSSSVVLAKGIERLILLDGKSSSFGTPWKGYNRAGEFSCWMYRANELTNDIKEIKAHSHYTTQYNGMVYCATVPGSLLLTRRGIRSPVWNGNSIQTDQFGFISPTEGPECLDKNTSIFTYDGWISVQDMTPDTLFACNIDGLIEFHKATALHVSKFEGELICIHTADISMSVTPNHRVYYTTPNSTAEAVRLAADLYNTPINIPEDKHNNNYQVQPSHWSKEPYNDLVYCATVPGSKLLVRGSETTQAYWTGNSERVGIDVRLAWGTKIGSDGKPYQKFFDRRAGKPRWMSPEDLDGMTIKVPD